MNAYYVAPSLENSNQWDWVNDVLYRMCIDQPAHTRLDVIAGKVFLIGRAYSAAIERGAGERLHKGLDNFYLEDVAKRMLVTPGIDTWLDDVRAIKRITYENLSSVLRVHKQLTGLFEEIAGTKKRSLASKYLHFHLPNAFFVFDSNADSEIRKRLRGRKCDVFEEAACDTSYAEFAYRCLCYRDNILEPRLGMKITPRDLDKDLLNDPIFPA